MTAGAPGTGGRQGVPAGVLLAAGAGTRFGGPKALAELDGEPLVVRGLRVLRAAGCRPAVAVLGAEAASVRARTGLGAPAGPGGQAPPDVQAPAGLARAEVVVNDAWQEGLSTSLRAGLEALRGRAPAAVVALADQPLVTPEAVRRLTAAWEGGAVAAVAAYGGSPRNPVLLDASVWDEVLAHARGDEGARAWLRAHASRVTAVECGDVASPADVDVPADLERLGRGG